MENVILAFAKMALALILQTNIAKLVLLIVINATQLEQHNVILDNAKMALS